MNLFVGLDVSGRMTSVYVMDMNGKALKEAKVESEPQAIAPCLARLPDIIVGWGWRRANSQWPSSGLAAAGYPIICVQTRHRKVGSVTRPQLEAWVIDLSKERPNSAITIVMVAGGPAPPSGAVSTPAQGNGTAGRIRWHLPPAHDRIGDGPADFTHHQGRHTRGSPLQSITTRPAHFGLIPARYQPGGRDRGRGISKCGDSGARWALAEAPAVILRQNHHWRPGAWPLAGTVAQPKRWSQ
ncbi:transposase [Paracoccus sp. SCN 68-21]|uniref:transposase n=1 Tax=Paracoccus TaxID=265 RepID=UPI0026C724B6